MEGDKYELQSDSASIVPLTITPKVIPHLTNSNYNEGITSKSTDVLSNSSLSMYFVWIIIAEIKVLMWRSINSFMNMKNGRVKLKYSYKQLNSLEIMNERHLNETVLI